MCTRGRGYAGISVTYFVRLYVVCRFFSFDEVRLALVLRFGSIGGAEKLEAGQSRRGKLIQIVPQFRVYRILHRIMLLPSILLRYDLGADLWVYEC